MADKRNFGGRNYFAYGKIYSTKREAQREAKSHRDHMWVRVVKVEGGYRIYRNSK